MTPYRKPLHPLVQRMAEDMTIRNLSPRTIDAYTWHVDKFCQHFGKQPDQLGPEEIRQYQLYLVHDKKASWSSFNQAVCGLRFLYQVTLRRPYAVEHIPFGKKPKKLPTVLGDEEVAGMSTQSQISQRADRLLRGRTAAQRSTSKPNTSTASGCRFASTAKGTKNDWYRSHQDC